MNEPTIVVDGRGPAVRIERELPDAPALVWQAITERDQLSKWFPCDVIVEGGKWIAGARIEFPFPADVIDMTLTGEVLECDEPKVLSYTWGEEVLRFELSPRDHGTLLVLIDELPAESAARNAAGWEECLDRLAGAEPAATSWRTRFDVLAKAFEPILGPQAGPPEGYKGD